MTRKEFIKKYCWAPTSAPNCHQITWDLLEDIQETLENEEITYDDAAGAILYDINNLLEVVDKNLPDYKFLLQLKGDLAPESLTENEKKVRNEHC